MSECRQEPWEEAPGGCYATRVPGREGPGSKAGKMESGSFLKKMAKEIGPRSINFHLHVAE